MCRVCVRCLVGSVCVQGRTSRPFKKNRGCTDVAKCEVDIGCVINASFVCACGKRACVHSRALLRQPTRIGKTIEDNMRQPSCSRLEGGIERPTQGTGFEPRLKQRAEMTLQNTPDPRTRQKQIIHRMPCTFEAVEPSNWQENAHRSQLNLEQSQSLCTQTWPRRAPNLPMTTRSAIDACVKPSFSKLITRTNHERDSRPN